MALLNTIRSLFSTTMNTASIATRTTAQATLDSITGTSPIPPMLRPILNTTEAERATQELILTARDFYAGDHAVRLTARLIEWVGMECSPFTVRANYSRRVVDAPAERLVIEGFDSNAESPEEKARQIEFARAVWNGSRMAGKWLRTATETIRDGEYFLFVDWNAENRLPRLTPHHRYTDTRVSDEAGTTGTGDGARLFYPNNDVDQKPLYAIKRWVEHMMQPDGTTKTEPRLYVYTEARIYKWRKAPRGWELFQEPGDTYDENGAVYWLDAIAQPLGIPVVHLKTPALEPAAKEAIGPQKAVNKIAVDMLSASDWVHKLYTAFGWTPNGDSAEPGSIMVCDLPPDSASLQVTEGEDLTKQIQALDKWVAIMADVTNTPLSLLNRSSQRAAEGTLQEEKESFFAKVASYQETVEIALTDALRIARRLHNAAGGEPLDESAEFSVLWKPLSVRSVDDKAKEADALLKSGVPESEIWRSVWGYDETQIAAMQAQAMGEVAL